MSRALELFCCHYLLSPCSGPSTSVSFRLTRLSPLHSHTQLSLCDVSLLLLLLLLFISRCLPALLVLAFYETFQKIAFMMLLLTLSLFVLFTFQMFYSIPLCVGESFRFLHCSLFCVWWWWCCRFLFLFLLLCIGVIRGGLFCMVSERI